MPHGTRETSPGSLGAFAYGAFTRSGRPFQIVRLALRFLTSWRHREASQLVPTTPNAQRSRAWHAFGLGCSPFARRYLGNRGCFLFLRVLRWFNSPRSLRRQTVTGHNPGRVSPFGNPRVTARSQLPEAYRSLPRPSSLPCAKASTTRP